jgi:hypothetical protein
MPGAEGWQHQQGRPTLKQMLANSGFLSRPAELLGGYGLPQPEERKHLEQESRNARRSCCA